MMSGVGGTILVAIADHLELQVIIISKSMTFTAIVHQAEEGGYWAEVPALPGCVTEGVTVSMLPIRAIAQRA